MISGKRNLTPDLARRVAEACGLTRHSLDFFCALIAFNQAKMPGEREAQYAKLQSFRRFRETHRLDAAQGAYPSQWYIPAIFELITHENFVDDPHWIAGTLWPAISPRQAAHAHMVLERLGLTQRTQQGRLVRVSSVLETPEGPLGYQVAQFHRVMMQRASEAIERVPREQREIASLTLCISEQRLGELKAELEALQDDLVRRYQADPHPQRVVQVNFQMFPLSKGQE